MWGKWHRPQKYTDDELKVRDNQDGKPGNSSSTA